MTATSSDIYVAIDSSLTNISNGLSSSIQSEISQLWTQSKAKATAGETRVFYSVPGLEDKTVVVVSTGTKVESKGGVGEENKLKEITRRAAALGTLALKGQHLTHIAIDPLHSAHAAAVGAHLAAWSYSTKTNSRAKALLAPVHLSCLGDENVALSSEMGKLGLTWSTGVIYAEAQNLARTLMETSANCMTPTLFCDRASKELDGLPNVKVEVHDLAWAESKKMGSFISVSRGSDEPLRFLEAHYTGGVAGSPPLALVGKGITFDSGGLSIKPAAGMADMRGDMGGAAITLSAFAAIAKLKLPINVSLFIPLTENLIGPSATKPGDNVVAGNGITINVDNTDAEGRLVLADALYYASSQYKPHTVIDAATLTGAIGVALGNVYTGAYTNSDELWDALNAAGASEKDPLWRMPLAEDYLGQITKQDADLTNTGGRAAGSCTAALFLKRFVDGLIVDGQDNPDQSNLIRWAHLDIAGVMDLASSDGYNRAGMTGRCVRTLIEYARRSAL